MRNKREDLYELMCRYRLNNYEKQSTKLLENIARVKDIHKVSTDFIETISLKTVDVETAVSLLKKINPPIKLCKDFHHIFVLDCSGSMETPMGPNETRWTALVGCFNSYINLLKRDVNCKDVVSVIEYDSKAYVQCEKAPLSTDFGKSLKNYGGGTDFAVALSKAKQIVDSNDHKVYAPAIIFLSDGEASNGETEMKSLFNTHKGNDLKVFVIGFCEGDQKKLQNLANICGTQGKFLNSTDVISLEKTFISIEEQLKAEAGTTN